MSKARYDDVAEWYDAEFATTELGLSARRIVLRLLGVGPGRLLDVGCGGGAHAVAFAERGWTVTGVDLSHAQLELARARGVDVVEADATALPFEDASFDAAVSTFTHTDLEDFPAVLRETARVLRPEGRLVYLGVHPCFVGPHAFVHDREVPELYPGYRDTSYRTEAPGIWGEGIRAKVGATHLPLGLFLHAFLDAGFTIERFEEPEGRDYPHVVALRARR
ncbi:MAG TPA: methyltransferase domain-containing protein [Gaiellaceae bacterium]